MKILLRLFVLSWSLSAVLHSSAADEVMPAQKEYLPQAGKGRVVVLVSGHAGADNYTSLAKEISDKGYYVVLVDGNDFWIKDSGGLPLLKGVIARAQQSPAALPGKVGVVGASLGGAAGLAYAARLPDQVAAVIVHYPLTKFVTDPAGFMGKVRVPTLMLTGTFDSYNGCCMIEMARKLQEAAKAGPAAQLFELHEYPGVDHGFTTNNSKRRDAGGDALARTADFLKAHLDGS